MRTWLARKLSDDECERSWGRARLEASVPKRMNQLAGSGMTPHHPCNTCPSEPFLSRTVTSSYHVAIVGNEQATVLDVATFMA